MIIGIGRSEDIRRKGFTNVLSVIEGFVLAAARMCAALFEAARAGCSKVVIFIERLSRF